MKTRDTYKLQARVLKAMANESRLLIIDRLNDGECSAGELVGLVGTDASTVSKHLSILRSHGIVEDRRRYRSIERVRCLRRWTLWRIAASFPPDRRSRKAGCSRIQTPRRHANSPRFCQ